MLLSGRTLFRIEEQGQRIPPEHVTFPEHCRGVATESLRQALPILSRMGERRAFLTTDPDNLGSIRVIEANGGTLVSQAPDPEGSGVINQYWIELG